MTERPSQTSALADVPSTYVGTRIGIESDQQQRVTIEPLLTGEPWFQVLRGLVEGGDWARLDNAQRNVLIVVLELRDHVTGLAFAPIAPRTDPRTGRPAKGLLALTGLGKSSVYRATVGLSSVGLLAPRGDDVWQVLPGRVFASRRPPPIPAGGTGRPASGNVCPASGNQDAGGLRNARARSEQREIDKTDERNAAGIDLLLRSKGQFDKRDARDLAAKYDERQIFNAIAHADRHARDRKLRVGPGRPVEAAYRGMVAAALGRGWTLFDQAGYDRHTAAKQAHWRSRQASLLKEWLERRLSADDLETVTRAFGDAAGVFDSGLLSPQWQNRGEHGIAIKVLDAARERLASAEPTPTPARSTQ